MSELAFAVGEEAVLNVNVDGASAGFSCVVVAHERPNGVLVYKVRLTNGREVYVDRGGLDMKDNGTHRAMTWRDALLAMAVDARKRAANCEPQKNGPSDEAYLAERRGARYAFGVMATELEYMADRSNNRDAIAKLRRLLKEKS